MRFLVLALSGFLLSGSAIFAQTLPQLYNVEGVETGDVLNIRGEPSASAPIIGTLARDARNVEVVATNPEETWGQVNTTESSGWVNLTYMAAQGVHIDHYNLPDGLFCYGTEPFWSAQNTGGALHFDTPDTPARDLEIWVAQDSTLRDDLRRMVHFAGVGGPGVAFIYPASCNDGMSDREYGLAISLMTAPDASLLSGCCSLSR